MGGVFRRRGEAVGDKCEFLIVWQRQVDLGDCVGLCFHSTISTASYFRFDFHSRIRLKCVICVSHHGAQTTDQFSEVGTKPFVVK